MTGKFKVGNRNLFHGGIGHDGEGRLCDVVSGKKRVPENGCFRLGADKEAGSFNGCRDGSIASFTARNEKSDDNCMVVRGKLKIL